MKFNLSRTIKCASLMMTVVMLILPVGGVNAQQTAAQSRAHQDLVESGKMLFENRCSGCHGIKGDGRGPASSMLDIKPRDLTRGIFKFKSGASGTMPTTADLMKTLNQGLPGSSMPSFRLMTEVEKLSLIEYVKTLAPNEWAKKPVADGKGLTQRPKGVFEKKDDFIAYAKKGQVWFQELGCTSCHGVSGRGDGPSANTLKDMWGQPIKPADFSRKFIRRGWTVDDIAASVTFGVDGTPMPAYGDSVPKPEVVWQISAYILYMRGQAAGMYADNPVKPFPASGKLPQEEVDAVMKEYE